MLPGLFGYSLILELLVFYYALHLIWPTTPRRWLVLGVGIVALLAITNPSSHHWADMFSGNYDYFWDDILRSFGFN